MGLLSCVFPGHDRPLDLLREFQRKMVPVVIDIDESEVFSASVDKLESALKTPGQNPGPFRPLASMKRNASEYAPQYRFVVRSDETPLMEGAINRRTFHVTWNDPIPNEILGKVLLFTKGISGAKLEVEDDAGNPIDVETLIHSCR